MRRRLQLKVNCEMIAAQLDPLRKTHSGEINATLGSAILDAIVNGTATTGMTGFPEACSALLETPVEDVRRVAASAVESGGALYQSVFDGLKLQTARDSECRAHLETLPACPRKYGFQCISDYAGLYGAPDRAVCLHRPASSR